MLVILQKYTTGHSPLLCLFFLAVSKQQVASLEQRGHPHAATGLTIGDIRGEIGFAFQQDESQSLNSDRKASSSTWLLGASQ